MKSLNEETFSKEGLGLNEPYVVTLTSGPAPLQMESPNELHSQLTFFQQEFKSSPLRVQDGRCKGNFPG
eukprot:6560604-Alexandrium_andersonii.AAC.1